ncbi:hypothetical protein HanRHA438_Chr09g0427701 [Helianthus annuus]|nr:hypothetical protein HanRHA438_Chr09g0427701 [Helianthus annuus]
MASFSLGVNGIPLVRFNASKCTLVLCLCLPYAHIPPAAPAIRSCSKYIDTIVKYLNSITVQFTKTNDTGY